jgi:cell division protein FtsL
MAAAPDRTAGGAAHHAAGSRSMAVLTPLSILAVVASAFLVIRSSHECRQLYATLQGLEAEQWYLQEDYSRLLLEQSAWASHYRVEKVATGELQMHSPAVEELRVVVP